MIGTIFPADIMSEKTAFEYAIEDS